MNDINKNIASNSCPICSSDLKNTGEGYTLDEIFKCWLKHGIEFSKEVLSEYDLTINVTLCKCIGCKYEAYIPIVLGSDRFYQEISEMGWNWYYLSEKWEYQVALADLRGVSRLLDIGCGLGYFIQHCEKMGINADGIELNSKAASIAKSKNLMFIVKI
jgi:2-polyprenyl-3-methyl-5-hydroxy-6-metoxy-1,4-benzoquinol methylase